MNPPTHIIELEGEVILILRNADCSFARAVESTATGRASDLLVELRDGGLQRPTTLFKNLHFRFELPELSNSRFAWRIG